MLEQATCDLLVEAGLGERMQREGLVHGGIYLRHDGASHHIPMDELTGGRSVTVYGQTEVVKDLIAARLDSGAPLHFECSDVDVDRPARRRADRRLHPPGGAPPAARHGHRRL